jgi:hypothetical protein
MWWRPKLQTVVWVFSLLAGMVGLCNGHWPTRQILICQNVLLLEGVGRKINWVKTISDV